MNNFNMHSFSDEAAAVLREEIVGAENKAFKTEKTFYVSEKGTVDAVGSIDSPWSIDAFFEHMTDFEPNTSVLFERGSVFRISRHITAVSGVSYGAYGTGPKPAFYNSPKNYAEKGSWRYGDGPNIWAIDFPASPKNDVGTIVFDDGALVGCPKTDFDLLEKDGDFFHSTAYGVLYLYLSAGSPDTVYNDIEICAGVGLFSFSLCENVVFDNLCLKYCGRHALVGHNTKNITVTNCEIGWIGGTHLTAIEKYGNGIEFYAGAKNILVENCWLYQIYDAALTFQMTGIAEFENITFRKNLIEYSTYSVEYFNYDGRGNYGPYRNIHIEDNIMRFAGYGWTRELGHRRYWIAVGHLVGWSTANEDTKDFYIQNNIFDVSLSNIVFWNWSDKLSQQGLYVSDNIYCQKPTEEEFSVRKAMTPNAAMNFGQTDGKAYIAHNQQEFEKAVATFDSKPKLVKWCDK